jgi:hypothetical protein
MVCDIVMEIQLTQTIWIIFLTPGITYYYKYWLIPPDYSARSSAVFATTVGGGLK